MEIERRAVTYSQWKNTHQHTMDQRGWHPITFDAAKTTLKAIKDIQVCSKTRLHVSSPNMSSLPQVSEHRKRLIVCNTCHNNYCIENEEPAPWRQALCEALIASAAILNLCITKSMFLLSAQVINGRLAVIKNTLHFQPQTGDESTFLTGFDALRSLLLKLSFSYVSVTCTSQIGGVSV